MFDIESGWNASKTQDILNDRLFGCVQNKDTSKPTSELNVNNCKNERKRKKKKQVTDKSNLSSIFLGSGVDVEAKEKTMNVQDNPNKKDRKKKKRVDEMEEVSHVENPTKKMLSGEGNKKKRLSVTKANIDTRNAFKVTNCIESLKVAGQCADDLPEEPVQKKRKKLKKKRVQKTENKAPLEQGLELFDDGTSMKTLKTNVSENITLSLMEERVSSERSSYIDRGPNKMISQSSSKHTKFQTKLNKRLESGQFRWINEQLYTNNSSVAKEMFSSQPKLFQVYHKGFQTQVDNWPQNPVDLIIGYIESRDSSLVVADFGCGDAKIARTLSNKVHSFDLVAVNEHVVACDMRKVPLENSCIDIVVFCLSLMGTNLLEFLMEAKRILKNGGTLLIAEVKSRFENVEDFVDDVLRLGFDLIEKEESNKMFVMLNFVNGNPVSNHENNIKPLKPCIYKRR